MNLYLNREGKYYRASSPADESDMLCVTPREDVVHFMEDNVQLSSIESLALAERVSNEGLKIPAPEPEPIMPLELEEVAKEETSEAPGGENTLSAAPAAEENI